MSESGRGVPVPKETRSEVFARDQYQCVVCGRAGVDVHHLIKRSQGGSHDPENLATVCRRCHRLLEANRIDLEGFKQGSRFVFYVRGSRRALFTGGS